MVVLTYLFTDFFTVERLVRDPFRTSSQNGGRIFCLSLQLSGRGSTVVFTLSRLLAKLLSNLRTFPYFCPELEWGHNRFRWFPICADLGSPVFFLDIFNYCSDSSMAGWPTTSALVWLTKVRWPPPVLSVCFFFLFSSVSPFTRIPFIPWTYHATPFPVFISLYHIAYLKNNMTIFLAYGTRLCIF